MLVIPSAARGESLLAPYHSRLFSRMPADLDLRDEVQSESILATADALLERADDETTLAAMESLLASDPERWPIGARVAVKLARSKVALRGRRRPLHLSVVIPLYAENERIREPHEHPMGEGFIGRKLRELHWLMGDIDQGSFEILFVDDGCPFGSGRIAEDLLRVRYPAAPARVIFLVDAIEQELPVTVGLASIDDSRKGGSIHLGLWELSRQPRPGQVVIYTDADLSTNLGQCGLLVQALDDPNIAVAAGSRRSAASVAVKSAGRSARGRLFIYLWKRLVPELGYLEDTQCGFKAMSADTARRLVEAPVERGFAFDLELLLRCELGRPRSVARVPIAWVDSEPASTTTAIEPYLPMLRGVVRLSRRYLGERAGAESFARVIESLDEVSWERAIALFGPRLEAFDSSLDCDFLHVSPHELMAMAR